MNKAKAVRGLLTSVCVLFTLACKQKVYWVEGQTSPSPGTQAITECIRYPELPGTYQRIQTLNWWIDRSTRAEDLESLTSNAQKIDALFSEIKTALDPQFTNSLYPTNYGWKIWNGYLPKTSQLTIEAVFAGATQLPTTNVKISKLAPYTEITLSKNASLLELCDFRKYIQILVAVRDTEGVPAFYYRLGLP